MTHADSVNQSNILDFSNVLHNVVMYEMLIKIGLKSNLNRLVVKGMYGCTLESLETIGKANRIIKGIYF